jgi:hypothetical protein
MTIIISRLTQKLLNQMMSKYDILELGVVRSERTHGTRRDIGLWRLDELLSNITFDLWRLASSLLPWFVPLQCH